MAKVKETKRKTVEYGKYGYLFIAPFFIVFLIFQLYPLFNTFYSAFQVAVPGRVLPGQDPDTTFGLANFTQYVFGEAKYSAPLWNAVGVTIVLWLLNFIPQILLSLLLASWFTDAHTKLKAQGAYKVIMYMPNIITAASLAFLFYALFGVGGVIPNVLMKLGVKIPDGGLLDHGWYSLFIIAFIQFWMWYGNTMIVLIAGIMGISPSLYEAAMVDGATPRQQFFRITLPLLKPILQYTLVTSAIGGMQMYDIPKLFNDGGPVVTLNGNSIKSTTTIVMLIKNHIDGASRDLGRASAYSVVLFAITLAISMIFYVATAEKKKTR